MHTKSRKLARQRANLTVASQHYSHLTPSQKAITRHQIEEVEYQQSHGKTDTKLLLGRQLFISKEMHSLETAGKQLVLPYQLCIMLVDESLGPLAGELWLRYLKDAEWLDVEKEELATGSWLFSETPRGQAAYRPYGEAEGYFDPQLPEHQFMTEDEILPYHYHVLHLPVDSELMLPNGDGDYLELLPYGESHWQKVLHEDTEFVPPNGGGAWGYFTGECVKKNWYPMTEQADLFTFTHPEYAAQHIYHVIVHCLVGSDTYPYGQGRIIFKTHGHTCYSDYFGIHVAHDWIERDFTTNPYTNKEWTREELESLQLGISLDKVGSFGNIMCDQIYLDIHYL